MRYPDSKEVDIFLLRFYLIGSVGFLFPVMRNLFIFLIPFTLLLNFLLILWREPQFSGKGGTFRYLYYLLITYFGTFIIEMIGVNTGVLFGNYTYGYGLGWKVFGTPLLIGVNWIVLLLGSARIATLIAEKLGKEQPNKIKFLLRIFTGAMLMVLYDLVLEQVAPLMQMWSWNGGEPPLQNYLMWFFLSIIFHAYYVWGRFLQKERISSWIFILQYLFFVVIYLGIRFI